MRLNLGKLGEMVARSLRETFESYFPPVVDIPVSRHLSERNHQEEVRNHPPEPS